MDETFRHNGLTTASDIQNVPPAKLRDIFGADAALYTTVTNYGAKFVIVDSRTVVTADAKLVDLRPGDELWKGQASANGKEVGYNFGVGGLTGAIATGGDKGLPYGPRSPKLGTD